MSATTLSTEQIKRIERETKAQLILRIECWEREHNMRAILGGPRAMSKQELVTRVCRIERGEEI